MKKIFLVIALAMLGRGSAQVLMNDVVIAAPFSDNAGFAYKWDTSSQSLIFFRDVKDHGQEGVRVYSHGAFVTPAIKILKGLSEATSFSIWDVAADKSGDVLLSGIAYYGPLTVRHLLLTYGSDGKLRKLWDMHPYHHHRIAVDSKSNVFAFGESTEGLEKEGFLISKYSAEGKLLKQFLPASDFAKGARITNTSAATGEHSFFMHGSDELILYVAGTKELLRFDVEGNLKARSSLAKTLERVASMSGHGWAEVSALRPAENGQYLAQLRLWPKDKLTELQFALFKLDSEPAHIQRLSDYAPERSPGALLDYNSSGEMLFLKGLANGKLSLSKYKPN